MDRISEQQIELKVRQDSVGGLEKGMNDKGEKLKSENMKPEGGKITEDEMIVMEQYAKLLPRGNRKLKLNLPELRDTILAKDLIAAPLTKSSGLNRGGNNSLLTNGKLKTQKDYIVDIQNKNALSTNPNFTSFKNNFSL